MRELHADQQLATKAEPDECGQGHLRRLAGQLRELRDDLLLWESRLAPLTESLPEPGRSSARNLVHYLALRTDDLRPLQEALAACGLSSLGRAESHVLANLDAILSHLDRGEPGAALGAGSSRRRIGRAEARSLLQARADALFGAPRESRGSRIMVTIPEEAAADDSTLVHDLLASGMDCLRINCAHGDPDVWLRIIRHLRRAEEELGRPCAILMDLSGPRARLGDLEPGPEVMKVGPSRDDFGRVKQPATVWLTTEEEPAPPPKGIDAVLPLSSEVLGAIAEGDHVELTDAAGVDLQLETGDGDHRGRLALLHATAYITSGMPVRVTRAEASIAGAHGGGGDAGRTGETRTVVREGRVGGVPPTEQRLRLAIGDTLILTRSQAPGRPAAAATDGTPPTPARIPCTPPEVLDDVRAGHPIWFDEGRVGGVIKDIGPEEVVVSITHARPSGDNVRAQKGINLPDTDLSLPALTPQDIENLPFVVRHADLVGYSFVRTPENVEDLYRRLDEMGASDLGVVLKIEAARAFEELPAILLAALRRPVVGVMIARGDLAVECGFARLAEVQEEILWLCEAAHLPVIWATQVLEDLSKRGRPSRAEVTDAAAGARAECVMLNKGAHMVEAVRALSSILERMQSHQAKKQSLLRHLRVAESFLADAGDDRPAGG